MTKLYLQENQPEGGFDLEPYPAVRAWLERVATQPGHVAMAD